MQVAHIKRESAQAEAQVSQHEATVREVKNIAERDRDHLRWFAAAFNDVPVRSLDTHPEGQA